MSLPRLDNATRIADRLNELADIVKTRSRASLTDANHILETITKRFFNALFAWDLVNLNTEQPNYPAADLSDRRQRIAIQVTNEDGSDKITRTTSKAIEHCLGRDFDRLIIFFLLPKKPRLPKGFVQPPQGPKIETWDIPDLLKKMQDLSDLDALSKAAKVLDEEMGKIPRSDQAPKIAVTRLRHGADRLVGRENELAALDKAWDDPATHAMIIVAWGGVGKTALVVDWMARMAADNWRGAECVFDWSFYSQGTRDTVTASSDAFIAKALEFFGDLQMAQSAVSAWDKGERLARLVAARRTLLVLDGVEPLQYPPGTMAGKLKDQALEALLKGLAQHNAGLCLVTTREPVTDLDSWMDKTVAYLGTREHSHDKYPSLSHLSEEAGAQLLFDAGVDKAGHAHIEANDQELKQAAREVGGHALTLQLLGRWLAKGYNGDVRKRDLVGFRKADARTQGGHAFRMLAAYEHQLTDAGEEGQKQLAVLHLLGLFDGPAEAGCITALRQKPAIEGLTESLIDLDDEDWNFTLSNLREAGLIAARADETVATDTPSALDAHPLVREYFAAQLRGKTPKAWQAAHRRLYEHLTQSTEHQPDTLAGLQPLYQAVAHGCLAGMQQEACAKVYRVRILRGTGAGGFYSTKKLGAFGSDLAGVACFFERPFSAVSKQLPDSAQAWLLNQAAFSLRALGRLTEALEPMRAATQLKARKENWHNAAICASNLSEMELTLGQVANSVADAERSVDYADRSGDTLWRMACRTTLADALFQSGRTEEAAEQFRQAEAVQAKNQSEYPLLYSLWGFRYCDLLLVPAERTAWQLLLQIKVQDSTRNKATAACRAVRERATQTLEWAKQFEASLLSVALDHLREGQAGLYKAVLADKSPVASHESLKKAADALRRASHNEFVARGLLSQALLRFVEGDTDGCRADLDEAWQIAERGSMKLHMADVHLHRARLFHDKESLAKAEKLIDECGYHRRDPELADAEEAAKNW